MELIYLNLKSRSLTLDDQDRLKQVFENLFKVR